MDGITINNLWALLLAGASALVLLANAVEKIVKIRKAAKAPNDQQDARLDALEAWRKEVDSRLLRDNERLAAIEEGDRVSQVALLALLDHGLDGNNVKQMQDAKERLQTHLINR
jgi:hypothetical protein